MKILISTQTTIDPILLEQLVQLPNASIFLSLCREDTLRIMREARPEILITDQTLTSPRLLFRLAGCNFKPRVYLYIKTGAKPGDYLLTQYQGTKGDGSGSPVCVDLLTWAEHEEDQLQFDINHHPIDKRLHKHGRPVSKIGAKQPAAILAVPGKRRSR